jgi:hypothetical protein
MSKNISISDEVYERLKREKGDKSFSELIAEKLDEGHRIEDVSGQQILEPETLADRRAGRPTASYGPVNDVYTWGRSEPADRR